MLDYSPATRTMTKPAQPHAGRRRAAPAPRSHRADAASVRRLLHDVFGLKQLREGQQAVIDNVLAGRDTLAVMPTGAGKSLCYQVPAGVLPGITIVVSPLIALMKDQLEKLAEHAVAAVQANSSLSREEETETVARLQNGDARILFCTPERLAQPAFLQTLRGMAISLVAIDEAHCISQWGHDFRPAYLELAAAIDALGRPPVLALTATATDEVIEDIRRQLDMPDMRVIHTDLYRPNLRYRVLQTTNPAERDEQALRLVRDTPGSGIVYTSTVKAANALYAQLRETGASVACYHGRLSARERRDSQDLFMNGARRVMVATNAFGMGIDKPDVRFVLHLQLPASLDAYYQESGRAGRDRKDADCTLLFLQGDKRIQQFFLARHDPTAHELAAVYQAARELAPSAPFFPLAAIADRMPSMPQGRLKICLRLLKDSGLLRQNRRLDYALAKAESGASSAGIFAAAAQDHEEKQEHDRQALEQMVAYAQSGACRWKLLLDHFGDGEGFARCGSCDNCVSPPQLLETKTETGEAGMPAFSAAHERPQQTPAPQAASSSSSGIAAGSRVRVPKFGVGTAVSVEADKIVIAFPNRETRTFLADFVEPLDAGAAAKS